MIRLFGSRETISEWSAGETLCSIVKTALPHLATSAQGNVTVIVSAQTPGMSSNVADIDLVAFGTFPKPIQSSSVITSFNQKAPTTVQLRSFAVTIEVKDHDARFVKVDANRVYVRYSSGWSDATGQSIRQREALREFLTSNLGSSPYIVNLLWLRNVRQDQLRQLRLPEPNNVLSSEVCWDTFLRTLFNLNPPRPANDGIFYGVQANAFVNLQGAIRLLTSSIEATTLDRKRIEQITREQLDLSQLDKLGSKQVVLRGKGGSGKTIALLRSAYKLYQAGARVLILTYNVALVSDLRRQMAILRINDDVGQRNIRIVTVHSFLISIMRLILVISLNEVSTEWLQDTYPGLLKELIAYLKVEALSRDDLKNLINENGDLLGWDFICIDEGQDWLDEERDLLHAIFGAERFLVVDGQDQLVRRSGRCIWDAGPAKEKSVSVSLRPCLRLKSGLLQFVNAFALELDLLGWELEGPSPLAGGRVSIVVASHVDAAFQKTLVNENALDGNKNIDMLYCMTTATTNDPSFATKSIADELISWGHSVWNGTDPHDRRQFPISIDQCRVVQYESCRGLEGWTVVLNDFDAFYEAKLKQSVQELGPDATQEQSLLYAGLWAMIPLTRAIDHLVITVASLDSRIGCLLKTLANRMPDIVSFVN